MYNKRQLGAGESAAAKYGREEDEILILEYGEETSFDEYHTPEQTLLESLATMIIEESEKEGGVKNAKDAIIESFGVTIESNTEKSYESMSSMVPELSECKTKEDFDIVRAKYGDMMEAPCIQDYIDCKLSLA